MKTYYETSRLTLTLTNDELAYEILDYLRRNKSFLSPYEKVDEEEYFPGGNMNALVMRDVQRFKDKQAVTFWIRKRGEERIIGSVGLSDIIMVDEMSMASLNYRLDREEVRQGYMEEACRKCMSIAFDELLLHRLNVIISTKNEPSKNLACKLGFLTEGIARQFIKINECWEDHILMSKINE
jgi:ribosomal-protein-alanine N-acetyltransferase